jgi:hypothetical protein
MALGKASCSRLDVFVRTDFYLLPTFDSAPPPNMVHWPFMAVLSWAPSRASHFDIPSSQLSKVRSWRTQDSASQLTV